MRLFKVVLSGKCSKDVLHCHALRMRAASSRQLFKFFLVNLIDAHITNANSAYFLQPVSNFLSFSAQSRTFDNHAAILNPEIQHAQMPDIASELCANAVKKDVV